MSPTLCWDLCCDKSCSRHRKSGPVEIPPDQLALCWILLAMQATLKCWTFSQRRHCWRKFSKEVALSLLFNTCLDTCTCYTACVVLRESLHQFQASLRLHWDYRYILLCRQETAGLGSLDAVFRAFGVSFTSTIGPVLMRYLHARVLLDHEIAFLACTWLWAQPLWACVNKEHARCLQPSNGSKSSIQGVLDLLECAPMQRCCFSTWGQMWYRGVDLEEYVYRVG